MKYIQLILILCLYPTISQAQYEVLEAKKVKKLSGDRIKKGDFLQKEDEISVAEKGGLTLDVESAMHMKLGPGAYKVGVESKRHNEWYDTHLALTKELKKKGMIMCKFVYKTIAVPGSNRHYEVDRIELDQKPLVKIANDTTALTVSWNNPDYRFKGGYHLVVRDYYNHGFIDLIETDEKTVTFYPGKYGHRHIYYNVIADDCRSSLKHKIQVDAPGAQINSVTTFN